MTANGNYQFLKWSNILLLVIYEDEIFVPGLANGERIMAALELFPNAFYSYFLFYFVRL